MVCDSVRYHLTKTRSPSSQTAENPIADFIQNILFPKVSVSGDQGMPLAPVFTHMNGEHGDFYIPLSRPLDGLQMPRKGTVRVPGDAFQKAEEQLQSYLTGQVPVDTLLNVLEDLFSTLPAGCRDISLYDHLKLSAALDCCMTLWYENRGISPTYVPPKKDEPYFLLYSADLSGIQKFIYTVAESKALRSLRSRSFFLGLMMEHYVDELLRGCNLSRANLIYSGGGHCYLILPNTPVVENTVNAWNTRFNDFLLEQFGTGLFLGHGYTCCCANDLVNEPASEAPYKEMFRRVSGKIAAHKMHRYSPAQLLKLNHRSTQGDRECKVCGRADRLTGDMCDWCQCFVNLSRKIQDQDVFFVTTEKSPESPDFVLPSLDGQASFLFTTEDQAEKFLKKGISARKIYTKNCSYTSLPGSTRLYVGNYAASNSIEELARDASGICRIGVCRMDVDNLGQSFVRGFEQENTSSPEVQYRYVNLMRTAAFSRQMSLFFQLYINDILSGNFRDREPLSVAVVYSGGDDVFLVGAWDHVMEAANRIQSGILEFSCGSLTISGGIGLFDDHFPIRIAAEETAALEDRAKEEPGKNAISLFDPKQKHTYSWDIFRNKVLGQKQDTLDVFFDTFPERGNSLIYSLLDLLRGAPEKEGSVNLARYAYQLARLEPKRSDPRMDCYRTFADHMYAWAWNQEDREQLITAIYLYVYKNRKG